MSQMPRSNHEETTPKQHNDETNHAPSQLEHELSETMNNNTTTDSSVQSPSRSIDSGPNTISSTRKKGRGPAIGYQGKEKIKILFNELMQAIGDTSTDVANLLGGIAKCGTRAPLDVVSWNLMLDTNLEIMWKHVQSIRNANNRKLLEFLPRTGRTSHANIREEMKVNNEDISCANVFIKTRTKNDGTIPDDDTRMVVDRMNEKLNEVPWSEQTDPFKKKVFMDLMGSDGHGRVRTFGVGPSPRDVLGAPLSSKNTSSSDVIKMMVQSQVEEQLEARVAERVTQQVAEKVSHYEKAQVDMQEKVSQYEKTQVEMKKQMDGMQRLLEFVGLLPQSHCHETSRSRSSDDEVHTTSNGS